MMADANTAAKSSRTHPMPIPMANLNPAIIIVLPPVAACITLTPYKEKGVIRHITEV
jgi:hypothetical protein